MPCRVAARSALRAPASRALPESSHASRWFISCWIEPSSAVAAAWARSPARALSDASVRYTLVATLVQAIAMITPAVASAHSIANRRTWDEIRGCAGTRGWSSCRTGGFDRIHLSVAGEGHSGITQIRDAQGARRSFATNAAWVTGIFAAKSSSTASAYRRISRWAVSEFRSDRKFMRLRAFTVQ